jgi:hypothetical protein
LLFDLLEPDDVREALRYAAAVVRAGSLVVPASTMALVRALPAGDCWVVNGSPLLVLGKVRLIELLGLLVVLMYWLAIVLVHAPAGSTPRGHPPPPAL